MHAWISTDLTQPSKSNAWGSENSTTRTHVTEFALKYSILPTYGAMPITSRTPTLCSREHFWKMGRKASLERFGNLSTLAGSSLGILIFLPTHRIHRIPGLARCHDDPQVIARSREVVVRLITKGDRAQESALCSLLKHRYNSRLQPAQCPQA